MANQDTTDRASEAHTHWVAQELVADTAARGTTVVLLYLPKYDRSCFTIETVLQMERSHSVIGDSIEDI